MTQSDELSTVERLLELNKPAAIGRVTVRRRMADGDLELISGPMDFEPRDSDGNFVFTVGGTSFTADDVVEIDCEAQVVWIKR